MGTTLYPLFVKKLTKKRRVPENNRGEEKSQTTTQSDSANASDVCPDACTNVAAFSEVTGDTGCDAPLSSTLQSDAKRPLKKKRTSRSDTRKAAAKSRQDEINLSVRTFVGLRDVKPKQTKLPSTQVLLEHALSNEIKSVKINGEDGKVAAEETLKFTVKNSTRFRLNLCGSHYATKQENQDVDQVIDSTCIPRDTNCHDPVENPDGLDILFNDRSPLGGRVIGGKRNILSHLTRRETFGKGMGHALAPKQCSSRKDCFFVDLQPHPGRRQPQLLAWDSEGVLLAVSFSDRTIAVYDWDMFAAAESKSRRENQRRESPKYESSELLARFDVPPILVFRVPLLPASLTWNPHHADQLAVSFCRSSHVHLYRVDKILIWAEKSHGSMLKTPPTNTFADFSSPYTPQSATSVLFLDSQTLLACLGKIVCCWSLSSKCTTPHRLLWTLQNPSAITCAAKFGTRMVLLGSEKGHLTLVDWKDTKCKRTFSSFQRTPKLLNEWKPHKRKYDSEDSMQEQMGIRKIYVEGDGPVGSSDRVEWGCHRVFWVTGCGWLMSSEIESPSRVGRCRIWHVSPKVIVKNASGEIVSLSKRLWSQPKEPLAVNSNSFVCWTSTPRMTRILSHHDKFVLDSRPSTLYSDKKSLLWMDKVEHGIQRIVLPSSWEGLPKAIAVHPNKEWIVICDDSQLRVLVSR